MAEPFNTIKMNKIKIEVENGKIRFLILDSTYLNDPWRRYVSWVATVFLEKEIEGWTINCENKGKFAMLTNIDNEQKTLSFMLTDEILDCLAHEDLLRRLNKQ